MVSESEVIDAPADRRPAVIGRAVLAALWLVWAVLAFWSAPRAASIEHLDNDLAADRIVSYNRIESWNHQRLWFTPPGITFDQHGGLLIWTTPEGQTFYATPDYVSSRVELPLSFGGKLFDENSETAQSADRLREAGIPMGGPSGLAGTVTILALVLVVLGLAILIGGPNPQRGTRWFWFWVGQIPLGLGYLAWLIWERPWAPDRPEVKQRNGWTGLGVMLLGTIVVLTAAEMANRYLGPWFTPIIT